MKKKMTFMESLQLSWQRELEIGDPFRILQLVRGTVHYGLAHVLFSVIPDALIAAGKRWQEREDAKTK